MPNFLSILDPIRYSRLRQQGYHELNGRLVHDEEYQDRVQLARERLNNGAHRNGGQNRNGNANQGIGQWLSQSVANWSEDNVGEQIRNYGENPLVEFGLNHALGGVRERSPLTGHIFNSALYGGIAGALSGNPLVGAGVGVTKLLSGLPKAISESLSKQTNNTDENDINERFQVINENPQNNGGLVEVSPGVYRDTNPQTVVIDEDIIAKNLAENVVHSKKQDTEKRGFTGLTIQRTDSFSLTPTYSRNYIRKPKQINFIGMNLKKKLVGLFDDIL